MTTTAAFTAVAGGVLIGLAASLFLLTHGRVAGISGLFAGAIGRTVSGRSIRIAFLGGLLAAGGVAHFVAPSMIETNGMPTAPLALVAGVLVGFGTQLGNGCTSGHGVCGTSRLSKRSLVATVTFMAVGMLTVFVTRHVLRGGW